MSVRKTIMISQYIVDQFPSRYQAALALIKARLTRTPLDLKGIDFSLSDEDIKRSFRRVPCQTSISELQAEQLRSLGGSNLSALVREALNYTDRLGQGDAV